jgi:hypothetical protein
MKMRAIVVLQEAGHSMSTDVGVHYSDDRVPNRNQILDATARNL